jgi:hypothetical protein
MSTTPTNHITSPSYVVMDPPPSPQLGEKREHDNDKISERSTKKIKTSHTKPESPEQPQSGARLNTPPSEVAADTVEDSFRFIVESASQYTEVRPWSQPRRSERSVRTQKIVDYVEIIEIDNSNSSTDESVIVVLRINPATKSTSETSRTSAVKTRSRKSKGVSKNPAVKTRVNQSKNSSKITPKCTRQSRSQTGPKQKSLIVKLKIDEDALERTLNPKKQPVVPQATESFMRDYPGDEIDDEMVDAAMSLIQISQQTTAPLATPLKSLLIEYFRGERLRKQGEAL